jgi:hypothetical protein
VPGHRGRVGHAHAQHTCTLTCTRVSLISLHTVHTVALPVTVTFKPPAPGAGRPMGRPGPWAQGRSKGARGARRRGHGAREEGSRPTQHAHVSRNLATSHRQGEGCLPRLGPGEELRGEGSCGSPHPAKGGKTSEELGYNPNRPRPRPALFRQFRWLVAASGDIVTSSPRCLIRAAYARKLAVGRGLEPGWYLKLYM